MNKVSDNKNLPNWVFPTVIAGILVLAIAILYPVWRSTQAPSTSSQNSTSNQPKKAPQAAWDPQADYDRIETGMTKQEVESFIGRASSSCSESVTENVGKFEICFYGNLYQDGTSISVTYKDEVVYSKQKTNQ